MNYQNQPALDPRSIQEKEAFTTTDQEVIRLYMFGAEYPLAAFAVENPNSKEEDIKGLMRYMEELDITHYYLYNVCQTQLTERSLGTVPSYSLKTSPQPTTFTPSKRGWKLRFNLNTMSSWLSRIWPVR